MLIKLFLSINYKLERHQRSVLPIEISDFYAYKIKLTCHFLVTSESTKKLFSTSSLTANNK
jgi:hypothetical protein